MSLPQRRLNGFNEAYPLAASIHDHISLCNFCVGEYSPDECSRGECSLNEYFPQRTSNLGGSHEVRVLFGGVLPSTNPHFGGTMGNTPPTSTPLMTPGKEHESQTVAATDEEVNVVPNFTMEDDIGWLDWLNNVD